MSRPNHPGTFFSFLTALLMAYQPIKSLASLNATLTNGNGGSRENIWYY